jgi:hypothetical protein
VWCVRLGEPLLCRLGFHEWRNYGNQVEISWREPEDVDIRTKSVIGPDRESVRESLSGLAIRTKAVYEGRECKRCGIRLKRKLVTNSDGTISSVGWEPDT